MLRFVILLGLLLVNLNGFCQSFSEVSKMASTFQISHGLSKRSWSRYCHNVRDDLYKSGKLNFVDESDTLFFLESSDIVSRSIYGKIWSRLGHFEYVKYNNDYTRFNTEGVYTDYTCKLLQTWDTASIRYEEKVNPAGFNRSSICGTRVIKTGSKIKIDCIIFKEFFKLERDR